MFPTFEDIEPIPINVNAEEIFKTLPEISYANYRYFKPIIWQRFFEYENIRYKVTLRVQTFIVKDIFGNYEVIKPEASNSSSKYWFRYIMEYSIIEPTLSILKTYNSIAFEIEDSDDEDFSTIETSLISDSVVDIQDFNEFMKNGEEYITTVNDVLSTSNEKLVKHLTKIDKKYKESKRLINSLIKNLGEFDA